MILAANAQFIKISLFVINKEEHQAHYQTRPLRNI